MLVSVLFALRQFRELRDQFSVPKLHYSTHTVHVLLIVRPLCAHSAFEQGCRLLRISVHAPWYTTTSVLCVWGRPLFVEFAAETRRKV